MGIIYVYIPNEETEQEEIELRAPQTDSETQSLYESLDLFKKELKELFQKHQLAIHEQTEYLTPHDDCEGIGTEVKYIAIKNLIVNTETLDEIITECLDNQ